MAAPGGRPQLAKEDAPVTDTHFTVQLEPPAAVATNPSPLKDPIEFCPAAACAAAIARLEGFSAHVARLQQEAQLARSPQLMCQLEAIQDELILAAHDARDRLAKIDAVSPAGAIAQLLAAIRDIRVRDDHESERAKDLEARVVHFLASAGLYDSQFSNAVSQTKLGRRLRPRPSDGSVRHTG
jgi:hypothetical protein